MSVTHVFKVVDGLSLEIDVLTPPTKEENSPALLHFHGGFLVSPKHKTLPSKPEDPSSLPYHR